MTAILAIFTETVWPFLKSAASAVISFCAQPPGSYLALALLIPLAWYWSGQRGYDRGGTDCQAAHAAAVVSEVQRQRTATVAVVARSEVRTNQNATADQKAQEEVRHVANDAKTQPSADTECVPASLADRLRGID